MDKHYKYYQQFRDAIEKNDFLLAYIIFKKDKNLFRDAVCGQAGEDYVLLRRNLPLELSDRLREHVQKNKGIRCFDMFIKYKALEGQLQHGTFWERNGPAIT
ncbi:MAG: hypothetical protein AB1571_01350 [Nanoarchaeota archaeon]